jgi:hypothetical protein
MSYLNENFCSAAKIERFIPTSRFSPVKPWGHAGNSAAEKSAADR